VLLTTARSSAATIQAADNKEVHRDCQARVQPAGTADGVSDRGATSRVVFGIIVLAGGDWIPGTLIVAASLIGLARQIPVINKLCRQAPPSPPHGKPTG